MLDTAEQGQRVDRMVWRIAVGGGIALAVASLAIFRTHLPAVHYGKAVQAVQAGRWSEGITEMQQTLTLQPELSFAAALLGEWHLEQGKPEAAIPILEGIVAEFPDAYEVEHNLALAYLGARRPVEAAQAIEKTSQYEQSDPWRADYILALASIQVGELNFASQKLRSVVQSQPDFREAQIALRALEFASPLEPAVALPYSRLAMKSEAWPFYP
jgi:predicted Zn-dependent protease